MVEAFELEELESVVTTEQAEEVGMPLEYFDDKGLLALGGELDETVITFQGPVELDLPGTALSRWMDTNVSKPLSGAIYNNFTIPFSEWNDRNVRQPATELTQPLRDGLNFSPEQWTAHKQLMIEWVVEGEKQYLSNTMTAFGESGLLSGSGAWSGNLGRVYDSAKLPKTLGNTTTALTHYYPPNGGALGNWENLTLKTGIYIDRYGSPYGKYFSPLGTPNAMRALPLGNSGTKTVYKVIKPFEVQSSKVAPWFGKPGLGKQYYSPILNADELVEGGYLKIITK